LNQFLYVKKFAYEKLDDFIASLQKFDFLGKVDCTSGYHTIKVHPDDRQFLCFFWKGRFYCFNVLPFGLSVAPWIYTVVMRELTAFWRKNGLDMIQYLDDSGWHAKSLSGWWQAAFLVVGTLQKCGFWLGIEKCILIPTMKLDLLGFVLDSAVLKVTLPDRRVEEIQQLCHKLSQFRCGSVAELRSLCGKIIACERVVWACKVYMRDIFIALKMSSQVPPQEAHETILDLDQGCLEDIRY